MIGLVLAVALAAVSPAQPSATQPPAAVIAQSQSAPAPMNTASQSRRHRHVRQPVPKPALWVGGALGLLAVALFRIGGRRGATIDLRRTSVEAIAIVLDSWRRAPGPLAFVAASSAEMTVATAVHFPPLLALILALVAVVGIYGSIVLPGAVCRVAFSSSVPDDERFHLRGRGLQLGEAEGRALGAILIHLLIVAAIWLPLTVVNALLTQPIAHGLDALQQQAALGGLLSDFRPPTKRELDFVALAFVGQIVGAHLILLVPSVVMTGKLRIPTLWRTTSTATLKLAILVFVIAVGWWAAAAVGPSAGAWITGNMGPAAVSVWAVMGGLLTASAFAFQVGVSISAFRQLRQPTIPGPPEA